MGGLGPCLVTARGVPIINGTLPRRNQTQGPIMIIVIPIVDACSTCLLLYVFLIPFHILQHVTTNTNNVNVSGDWGVTMCAITHTPPLNSKHTPH